MRRNCTWYGTHRFRYTKSACDGLTAHGDRERDRDAGQGIRPRPSPPRGRRRTNDVVRSASRHRSATCRTTTSRVSAGSGKPQRRLVGHPSASTTFATARLQHSLLAHPPDGLAGLTGVSATSASTTANAYGPVRAARAAAPCGPPSRRNRQPRRPVRRPRPPVQRDHELLDRTRARIRAPHLGQSHVVGRKHRTVRRVPTLGHDHANGAGPRPLPRGGPLRPLRTLRRRERPPALRTPATPEPPGAPAARSGLQSAPPAGHNTPANGRPGTVEFGDRRRPASGAESGPSCPRTRSGATDSAEQERVFPAWSASTPYADERYDTGVDHTIFNQHPDTTNSPAYRASWGCCDSQTIVPGFPGKATVDAVPILEGSNYCSRRSVGNSHR